MHIIIQDGQLKIPPGSAYELPTVIIDKNYLQGTGTEKFRKLYSAYQFLLPDVLFYELISAKKLERSRCFAKFPPIDNPITVIKNAGFFLRYEIEHHKPCGKPSLYPEDIRFRFNPALSTGEYEFPREAKDALEEKNHVTKREVSEFVEQISFIAALFPALLKGNDNVRMLAKNEAEKLLTANPTFILNLYNQFEAPSNKNSYPPTNLVTTDWAVFRWLQVKWLMLLDIYCRYNGKIPDKLTGKFYENIEHDMLDLEYLFLGVLEGTFATREKKLQRLWKILAPDGILLS